MELQEFLEMKVGDHFLLLDKLKVVVGHHNESGTVVEPITEDEDGNRTGMDIYISHFAKRLSPDQVDEIKAKRAIKKSEELKKLRAAEERLNIQKSTE